MQCKFREPCSSYLQLLQCNARSQDQQKESTDFGNRCLWEHERQARFSCYLPIKLNKLGPGNKPRKHDSYDHWRHGLPHCCMRMKSDSSKPDALKREALLIAQNPSQNAQVPFVTVNPKPKPSQPSTLNPKPQKPKINHPSQAALGTQPLLWSMIPSMPARAILGLGLGI